jgi:acylphosphatase
MKKAVRIYITGSMQGIFFKEFIRSSAISHNVKGFLRVLEDSRIEIFIEGDSKEVDAMIEICSKGPKYAKIRKVEQKEERLQDFKEFKILNF